MSVSPQDAAVSNFRARYTVEWATTSNLIQKANRFNRKMFCLERGDEADREDLEIDKLEVQVHNVVVLERRSDEIVGTLRLILPTVRTVGGLPARQVCAPERSDVVPLATTADMSRFIVPKVQRNSHLAADPLLHLGLVQGAVRVSRKLGITHWRAVMERSLVRLLRTTGIHPAPVGPCIEYNGLRQPVVVDLDKMLTCVERDRPLTWDLVTDGGRHWASKLEMAAV